MLVSGTDEGFPGLKLGLKKAMGSAALHPSYGLLLLRKTGRKTSVARQIETRRRTAIPGEAKMIDSPFHRTQNGVFSVKDERIDRSSGECRFKGSLVGDAQLMTSDWLGQSWPHLYPITQGQHRFAGLVPWGNVINRKAAGVYILVALDADSSLVKRRTIRRMFSDDLTGTLYIGASSNLASRLGRLCNAILPHRTSTGHGMTILRNRSFSSIFPPDSLAICWFETTDRSSAHEFEAELAINRYAATFYERPPFDGFK